jgi:aminopeptidase S
VTLSQVTRTHRLGGAAAAVVFALLLVGCTAPGVDHLTGRPNFPVAPEVAEEPEVPGFEARTVRDTFASRDMVQHLEALQDIADEHDGNRASGTSGYEASARYVEKVLRDAGYETVRQEFSYEDDHRDNRSDDDRDDRVESFSILADTDGDP